MQGLPDECLVVEITPLLRELILILANLAESPGGRDRTDAVVRLLLMDLSFQAAQPLNLPQVVADLSMGLLCQVCK